MSETGDQNTVIQSGEDALSGKAASEASVLSQGGDSKVQTTDTCDAKTKTNDVAEELTTEQNSVVPDSGTGVIVEVEEVPDSKVEGGEVHPAEVKMDSGGKCTVEQVEKDSPAQTNGNVDSKLSGKELAALECKVAKQIEYYFGDISLSRDRFLLDLISKNDGWVDLSIMLNFNRLRQLTKRHDIIVSALKKSTTGLMEVSEDGQKLRRLPSRVLPENTKQRRDAVMARSIYAKGFPLDSTLDQLSTYFTQTHGPTEQVFLRNWGPKDDQHFKGSVFAIFETKTDADKFVNAESIKYNDLELLRLYKQVYYDKKTAEKHDKRSSSKKPTTDKTEETNENDDERVKSRMTPGAVLYLTGLSDSTKLTHIKTFFMDISQVAWVDINVTKKEAWVRFQSGVAQESVGAAKEANEGKLVINEAQLEASVLEGEAEVDYWKKLLKELDNLRNQKRKPGGHAGKRKFQRKGDKSRTNKHRKFKDSDNENDDDDKDDSPPEKAARVG